MPNQPPQLNALVTSGALVAVGELLLEHLQAQDLRGCHSVCSVSASHDLRSSEDGRCGVEFLGPVSPVRATKPNPTTGAFFRMKEINSVISSIWGRLLFTTECVNVTCSLCDYIISRSETT